MINLLPPDDKDMYRYARRNRTLLHWITAAGLSLLGAVLLLAGGYIYMQQSIDATTKQNAIVTKQLKDQNITAVQNEVTDISNNLKLVVQVLSKQILFSSMLKQLASVTPSNTILTDLSIANTQGGVTVTAQTTNYDAATQLQINLADPRNKIFSQADIVSINCASGADAANSVYPCTATIRALFATDNPFLFINKEAKK